MTKMQNAGVLEQHSARYDPTVIPKPSSERPSLDSAEVIPPSVFHSSADYVNAYKSKRTTPTAVVEAFLASLKTGGRDRIFITLTSDTELRAAAAASTARYEAGNPLQLDGVLLVVKDELDVAGTPKTLGLTLEEARLRHVGAAEEGQTSWCVQKLLDAGMIFLGKTNMHEIGLDATNNNPNWGVPPNPYNIKYYPGGSSGGTGAAVGAGICPIGVGADGGGSVRLPAAYCGIYGLKPSHGRVSMSPTQSIAPSVGVIGPLAATMHDLEVSYRIMATPNPAARPFPPPLPTNPGRKILGIFPAWFNDCEPDVLAAATAAVSHLRDVCGYEVVNITLPYLSESRGAHALTILSEISGVFCRGSTHGLTPANRILVAVAKHTPARDLLLAQKLRSMMMSHLAFLYQQYPGLLIVTPTIPHAGVLVTAGEKGGAGNSDANVSLKTMRYAFLANWVGTPAITVPCGYAQSNMPIGLMAMGEWGDEEGLIRFGKEWERAWEGGTVGGTAEEPAAGRKRGDGWVDLLA